MTALPATDAHGSLIAQDGSVERHREPPDALAETRSFIRSWLHGIDVTGTGGRGGSYVGGHPDRAMDSAAVEADLWRCVGRLDQTSKAACYLSRILPWRQDTDVRRVPTGELDEDGQPELMTSIVTRWSVYRGWPGVLDPYLCARVPAAKRASVQAWQATVKTLGSDTAFYRSLGTSARLMSEWLGPTWMKL